MKQWTRSEVRARLSKVIKASEIDTFMRGCGGDQSTSVTVKDIEATVAEIYMGDIITAKNIMRAFHKTYTPYVVTQVRKALDGR